jgi:hypothetical protein
MPDGRVCIGKVAAPPRQEATSEQFHFWVPEGALVEKTQIVTCESELAGRQITFYAIVAAGRSSASVAITTANRSSICFAPRSIWPPRSNHKAHARAGDSISPNSRLIYGWKTVTASRRSSC